MHLTNGLLTSSHRPLYSPSLSRPKKESPPSEKAWDLKLVGFIHNVFHQATEPTLGIPMLFAGPLGQIGRTVALRGLLAKQGATWFSRGLSLKILPIAAEFGVETMAFGLGARSLSHLLKGPVPWDPASVMTDLALAGLTLAPIKVGGFIGRKGIQWTRGLDEFQPQLWSKADHRALFWTSQVSAYFGWVASNGLQAKIFPQTAHGSENIWADALGTQLALGMFSHTGRAALGTRFQAFEQKINAEAHRLYQLTKPQWNVPHSLRPPVPAGIIPANFSIPETRTQTSKGENIWNSVGKARFPSRIPTRQGMKQELEHLGQKIAAPSFHREDFLEVTERLDKLEQRARKLDNQELRQQVNNFFDEQYAPKLRASLPLEELPHLLVGLRPLNANNTQQWSNLYNLLKGVEYSLPSARDAIKPTFENLIAKVDGPGLSLLEKLVREDSKYSRFAWYLLQEVKLSHLEQGIRQDAQRRSDRLDSTMDLRHHFRP